MDIQRVNRSDAEKVYFHYRNMSGATVTANGAVCLDLGTTIDGISSIAPASASFPGWIGIADKDVADTGYGRTQVSGYRDSILLSHEGSSVTVTAGDMLHLVNGQYGLNTLADQNLSTKTFASACGFKYVICGTTTTISAAAYTDGIIRCL